MRSNRSRKAVAVAIAACTSLTMAACSSSKKASSNTAANGPVTITVDCMPAKSQPVIRQQWLDDVATFEKLYPNVTVKGIDTFPCETPTLFTAALKAGTEPNVFYTYFTDLQQVLDAGQAADISSYVNSTTVPVLNDLKPDVLNSVKDSGKLYGLPRQNYTMGLIINRNLFKQAGLNPDQPPTTWAQVEQDAIAINKLGHGIAGYGDYSAGNNGGWHFVAEMYALGGDILTSDGKKAAFNDAKGQEVLQNLYNLRWKDNVMGSTQLYKWGDLQKQMAAGKLGMYVAAPDDITYMVQTLGAKYDDYGMGPFPGDSGPAQATLAGGDDYMFNPKDTPAQIKAGIEWLAFKELTIGKGQFDYARNKAQNQAVGLPEPELFQGSTATSDQTLKTTNATMPVANYAQFVQASVPGRNEPPNAQAIYKVLDNAMSAVLTDRNANVTALLATAESQVNQVLANAQ